MSSGPSAAQKLIGDFAPKLVELTDSVLVGPAVTIAKELFQ